jgi:RNA polymerase sigma-70 factor (ECF subfamily)
MPSAQREAIEREVRRLQDAGDIASAASAAVRGYGPEILGFLVAMHRSDQDAEEVFSLVCERLFRGLPRFAWDSSLRTWAYTIARNASANFVRGRRNRARREVRAETTQMSAIADRVRSETLPHLRTDAKDKLAAIRDALPPEDRTLLVLRVDKRMECKDLARVMLGEGPAGEVELTREAQRLRKRFQLLKEKLVAAGRREGMLGES